MHGYRQRAFIQHRSYVMDTHVRNSILNDDVVDCIIHIIHVSKLPLTLLWPLNGIPKYDPPSLNAGDFNSHHSL